MVADQVAAGEGAAIDAAGATLAIGATRRALAEAGAPLAGAP